MKMTPQDVLLAGADDIFMHGLAKHRFRKSDDSCCVLGALIWNDDSNPTDAAVTILREKLGFNRFGALSLTAWNDDPNTTAEVVIQTLHDAARGIK